MILNITNSENFGPLQNFGPKTAVKFAPLTFIYGPNAGGKSTCSTMLHSVSTNLPALMNGRQKLGAENPINVGLTIDQSQQVSFANGEWSQAIPEIAVFDDRFIANHVFAGLSVTEPQRHNLFEFSIGDEAVKLNQQLAECSADLQRLQNQLLDYESEISIDIRPGLTMEEFVNVSSEVKQDQSNTVDVNAIESHDSDALSNQTVEQIVVRNRRDPHYSEICKEYLATTKKILNTEKRLAEIRQQILTLKQQVVPEYFEKINSTLKAMGANLKIATVEDQDATKANRIDYFLQIKTYDVSPDADASKYQFANALSAFGRKDFLQAKTHDIPLDADASKHQFANTLSAGERNSLALAFFIAKLELDDDLTSKIIVFDDPIASMDTSRVHFLQNAIARLAKDAKAIIIFSHSKPFLRGSYRASRYVKRKKNGYELKRSTKNEMVFCKWDIKSELIIDFHRRLNRINNFIKDGCSEESEQVAFDIRMELETYCQVLFCEAFTSSEMLGSFLGSLNAGNLILPIEISKAKIKLLGELVDFANPFHHIERDTIDGAKLTDDELQQYAKKLHVFMNLLKERELA